MSSEQPPQQQQQQQQQAQQQQQQLQQQGQQQQQQLALHSRNAGAAAAAAAGPRGLCAAVSLVTALQYLGPNAPDELLNAVARKVQVVGGQIKDQRCRTQSLLQQIATLQQEGFVRKGEAGSAASSSAAGPAGGVGGGGAGGARGGGGAGGSGGGGGGGGCGRDAAAARLAAQECYGNGAPPAAVEHLAGLLQPWYAILEVYEETNEALHKVLKDLWMPPPPGSIKERKKREKKPVKCSVPGCKGLPVTTVQHIGNACPTHAAAKSIMMQRKEKGDDEEKEYRFCVGCHQFQLRCEFDDEKKTCRAKLEMDKVTRIKRIARGA